LFDSDWYLAQNPDVTAADTNPLIHYINDGAAQGRDPNPYFDTDWYLAQNSDVAATGINPLLHYLRTGAEERRDPSPAFDVKWYLANNPDVAASKSNPLAHFLHFGLGEGRKPRSTAVLSIGIDELLPAGGQGPTMPTGLSVDVIVPVYRGLAETRRCIESVLQSR